MPDNGQLQRARAAHNRKTAKGIDGLLADATEAELAFLKAWAKAVTSDMPHMGERGTLELLLKLAAWCDDNGVPRYGVGE